MARIPYPAAPCNVWFCDEQRTGGKPFCIRHWRQWTRSGKTTPIAGQDAKILVGLAWSSLTVLRDLVTHCEQTCPFCGEHFNNHLPNCPMEPAVGLLKDVRV